MNRPRFNYIALSFGKTNKNAWKCYKDDQCTSKAIKTRVKGFKREMVFCYIKSPNSKTFFLFHQILGCPGLKEAENLEEVKKVNL